MPASTSVPLNTGVSIPTLGLGTWKSKPGEVENAVEYALKSAGYRAIDTATAYGNEKEVGEGIKRSGVPRGEIFLTTKLNNPDMGNPEAALEYSLSQLGTDYLDLWLMHWPAPMTKDGGADKTVNWLETWKEMERLYKAHPEKIRALGVSNISIPFFEKLFAIATVTPAVNQIELHPSCPQQELVDYSLSKGIKIIAYSPLGSDNSPLLDNPVVKSIASKYNVEPGTVLISLQANRPGVAVLPKSVKEKRILANAKFIDLTEEDIAALHEIDKTHHFRACNPNWAKQGNLGFPDVESTT